MGSVGNKYRVHEVAKDFGVPTKQITEILTKYAETPKNHMQVLGDRELSLIFESLTQHNQVSGIQAIYADAAKPAEKKAEPARQQPAARKAEAEKKPGQQAQQPQPEKKPVSRVPQTKVVDTRKATAVNMDKYDEKLQDVTSRHRGAKPLRRYELLGGISLLSPEYLLSFERCPFHTETPDHYALVSYLIDLSVSQSSALMPLHSNGGYQSP